jgi:hypothetical protein
MPNDNKCEHLHGIHKEGGAIVVDGIGLPVFDPLICSATDNTTAPPSSALRSY